MSGIIVYTMVKTNEDGTREPYKEWTENGKTISVGETVKIKWGSLAGRSGTILRFCCYRSDHFHIEVQQNDGTKSIWPINAVVYDSEKQLNSKPPRWQVHV